jgi:hypothetical protein
MSTPLPFPFDPATTARLRETGKTLRVLRSARKWYERDPQKYAMQIRLCDSRIEEALVFTVHVEALVFTVHVEAVLDSYEAGLAQAAADEARS